MYWEHVVHCAQVCMYTHCYQTSGKRKCVCVVVNYVANLALWYYHKQAYYQDTSYCTIILDSLNLKLINIFVEKEFIGLLSLWWSRYLNSKNLMFITHFLIFILSCTNLNIKIHHAHQYYLLIRERNQHCDRAQVLFTDISIKNMWASL